MPRYPGVRFVPPRSFSRGRPEGPARFIVIHHTAGAEGPTSAEDGAAYDTRRTDGTSAHFYIDQNSIVQCVDTGDRSHTALYHGNAWGIHLELCGTLQSRAQWLDAASRPTIRNAAKVCVWAMRVHDIPLTRLIGRQVRAGRGITGHVDCTTGFPEDGGTHTDPGPHFPWDVLFEDIRLELSGGDVALSSENVTYSPMPTPPADYEFTPGGRPRGPFPADDVIGDIAGRVVTMQNWLARVLAGQGVILGEVDGLEEALTELAARPNATVDVEALAVRLDELLGAGQTQELLDALAARLAG